MTHARELRAVRVTRPTYRRLFEAHALSHNVVLLGAGQSLDGLRVDPQRHAAILHQVSDLRRVTSRIHTDDPSLLAAIESDMGLLLDEQADLGALLHSAQQIHVEMTRLLETVEPPRWTPLGLRHRRRRQQGRDRNTS